MTGLSAWEVINFKECVYAAVDTAAILEIEMERMARCGVKGFKIIHGYGSHGKGGTIMQELRRVLKSLKASGKIKDYICGGDWCYTNRACLEFLSGCGDAAMDEDLNKSNPGITVVVL